MRRCTSLRHDTLLLGLLALATAPNVAQAGPHETTALCTVRSQIVVPKPHGLMIKWMLDVENTSGQTIRPQEDGNYGFNWSTPQPSEPPSITPVLVGAPAFLGKRHKSANLALAPKAKVQITVNAFIERSIAIADWSVNAPYDAAFVQFESRSGESPHPGKALSCNLQNFPGLYGANLRAWSYGCKDLASCEAVPQNLRFDK